MKTRLLILTLLILFAGVKTQLHAQGNLIQNDSLTRIPGTSIYFKLPKGFEPTPNSPGSFSKPGAARINGRVIKNDYEIIKKTATWQFFQKRDGYELVEEKNIEIDGMTGNYLEMINGNTRSMQICIGDTGRTFQVFAATHVRSVFIKKQLDEAFSSIIIDKDYDVPWYDLAGFRLHDDYDKSLSIGKYHINTFAFKSKDGLELKAMRLADIPGEKKSSQTILVEKELAGWGYRKTLSCEKPLTIVDTVINDYAALRLVTTCSEGNRGIELVQLIIEGKTQRILLASIIRDDFEENRKLVWDFIEHMVID